MVACYSCKNKNTTERCTSTALAGIRFCGRHAKMKNPKLWVDIHDLDKKSTKISKIWKGYFIRKQLQLAGEGVLKRKLCNNTDELISMESIESIYPLDYFGFEENGKIYGFDIRSLIHILNKNLKPANPYTRQPLTIETRKRLREIFSYRTRRSLPIFYEHNILKNPTDVLNNRWLQISQIVEENGFFDINPDIFLSLNKSQLYILLSMTCNDMKTWASEHKVEKSKRFNYIFWIQNVLKKFSTSDTHLFSFYVSSILVSILYHCKEPYSVCFIFMSSLYKL